MASTNESDFIELEDSDSTYEGILNRIPSLRQLIDQAPAHERAMLKAQIISALRFVILNTSKHPINTPEGGTSIIVKDRHINMNKVLLSSIELGANALVVILTAPSGGVGGLLMLPSIISTMSRLPEIVTKLDQSELKVLNAAISALEKKRESDPRQDSVTAEEIKQVFISERVEPPEVDDILEVLTDEKDVMTTKRGVNGERRYRITR